MDHSSPLHLLDLTLKPAGSIISSAMGEFTDPGEGGGGGGGSGGDGGGEGGGGGENKDKQQQQQQRNTEIAVIRAGGIIELYAVEMRKASGEEDDEDNEDDDDESQQTTTSLTLLCRIETRSILRSLCTIRLTGNRRDVIGIGSDSGKLTILDLANPSNPIILHCPSFGNTGCRRGTPGQYICSDPKGRAVTVCAIEKRKLVYVLNQDSNGNPTIASPLEAHKGRVITFDVVGCDNGYDNPIFAALEVQYPDYNPEEEEEEEDEEEENEDEDEDMAEEEEEEKKGDTEGEGKEGSSTTAKKSLSKKLALQHNSAVMKLNKQVAYYELDLGLNHVSRRWAMNVHRSACVLAPIPGGGDGPGGVLVGGEDYIEYVHESLYGGAGETIVDESRRVVCAIPRRKLHPNNKSILITQIVVHRQKRNKFFALCQSELGDLYKVSMKLNESKDAVISLTIHFMDTLPVCNSMNISRKGLLFVSCEFGNHGLYRFENIDLDGIAVACTSEELHNLYQEKKMMHHHQQQQTKKKKKTPFTSTQFYTTATAMEISPTFRPCNKLFNLTKETELISLSPAIHVLVGELAGGEVSPQIYTLCGRGSTSSLQILRHGLAVTELAVSDLPGTPGDIFTIQADVSSDPSAAAAAAEAAAAKGSTSRRPFDKFIIVSFADATLILSIGDSVEEVPDGSRLGFITNAPTLACSTLSKYGICQVHPGGVRHIQGGLAKQWHCPGLKRIERASCNSAQIIISLAGSGEVIYFELDPLSGNLVEAAQTDLGSEILCLDVGEVGKGRTRSYFAAVGCRDLTVRVLNLIPGGVAGAGAGGGRSGSSKISSNPLLGQRSSMALKARPHSVCLQRPSFSSGDEGDSVITLSIGLEDGSVLRTIIDGTTGQIPPLSSPTRRFLGVRPVSVLRSTIRGRPCTLMLSSRPWVSRGDAAADASSAMGATKTGGGGGTSTTAFSPLSYMPLDRACPLRSEIIREGIVATAGTTMRILTVDDSSSSSSSSSSQSSLASLSSSSACTNEAVFNANGVSLRYTPRGMCLCNGILAVVEADVNEYGWDEKVRMGFDPSYHTKKTRKSSKNKGDSSSKDTTADKSGEGGETNDSKEANVKKEEDDDDMDMDEDMDMDVDEDDDEDGGEKKAMDTNDAEGENKVVKQETKEEDNDDEKKGDGEEESEEEEEDDEDDDEDGPGKETPVRGPIPNDFGTWGSCIRLIDPKNINAAATMAAMHNQSYSASTNQANLLDVVEMDKNEAALCCTSVQFHSRGGESLLAVGTVTGYIPQTKEFTAAHIILYRMVGVGGGGNATATPRLQLLHKTKVEAPPLALARFQGRLLAGIGPTLRLYEMGKRQLLRKCEFRPGGVGVPSTFIKTLLTAGDVAYVGDLVRSVYFVKYDPIRNMFGLLGQDRTTGTSRCVTCLELLDVRTVAVGDKFGNVTVLRLPKGATATMSVPGSSGSGATTPGTNSGSSTVDASATRALWDTDDTITPKLDLICQYYVGEVVTGMTRASLVSGQSEALIYITVTGRIGALVPLQSRDDVEFYQSLESCLRTAASENGIDGIGYNKGNERGGKNVTAGNENGKCDVPRYTGRDPMAYRSFYAPIRHVIDGDLCESYINVLNLGSQKVIANMLDRTVGEVRKKLEDTRNGLL